MGGDHPEDASDSPTIQQYRSAYDQANRFAKEMELFRSAVVIPAHNELRNAGYHFLRSVSDEGKIVDRKELGKAIGHCDRSMYEASEAGIFHALKIIDQFQASYGGLVLPDYLKNWRDILLTAFDAREAVTAGRPREEAVAIVSVYMEHFRKLKAACRQIDSSRSVVVAAARRETWLFWFRFVAPVAVLCSGLLVSAATLFKEELRCLLIG